jgi:hypothetical protein
MAMMLLRRRLPAAAQLAENLLHTWTRGEFNGLELELNRAAKSPLDAPDDEERERLQLVKSIAVRMKDCPDVFAPRSIDPGLDSCLDLLAHVACRGNYPGWRRVPGRTREAL